MHYNCRTLWSLGTCMNLFVRFPDANDWNPWARDPCIRQIRCLIDLPICNLVSTMWSVAIVHRVCTASGRIPTLYKLFLMVCLPTRHFSRWYAASSAGMPQALTLHVYRIWLQISRIALMNVVHRFHPVSVIRPFSSLMLLTLNCPCYVYRPRFSANCSSHFGTW